MTYDHIPDELKALRQWVCWRKEERVGKNGKVETTKVPINARSRSGAKASSTSPNTWSSFEKAVERVENGYDWQVRDDNGGRIEPVNGIGFVFTREDPYVGFDLDADFDGPENALDVVARMRSYAEHSPSRSGIHIIGRGKLPTDRGKHPKGVGVFEHSRFFTFTGNVIDGFTDIVDIQDAIDHYWPVWFPEKPDPVPPTYAWTADDDDIIAKAERSKNGTKFDALYHRGDLSGNHDNESEADLALLSLIAFYTQDPAQIDRIFRSSKLYRPKWERADYREMTITKALERSAFYTPPGNSEIGFSVYRSSEAAVNPENDPNTVVSEWVDTGEMDFTKRIIDPDTGEVTEIPPKSPEIRVFNMTDKGNALRLVHHAGDRLRYVPKWGTWLVWDGIRWVPDALGQAMEVAKSVAETIYAEAGVIPDEKQAGKMREWAVKSESGQRLREMLGLAESDPKIAVSHDRLDADPMLLNVVNGTIDLRSGTLRPHDPDDLITKLAPVAYDEDATAPRWERFLHEAMGGDETLIEYLQRAVGYSLTGDISERKMFIIHGGTTTGKSTFIDTIHDMLGDYAKRSPNELMIARRGDHAIPHEAANLVGIRFTWVSETGEFDRIDESRVKDLVSGDTIAARLLHQNLFFFRPTFKLWAGTNHKPTIRATDSAIWRRVNLIPFVIEVPEAKIDRRLPDRLLREMPGILAWAVRGCLAWQRVGMEAPERVREETAEHREAMDVIGSFIRDECVVRKGTQDAVSTVYGAYREWSASAGERPMTKKAFSMRMHERGFPSKRIGRDNTYTYFGVRLRTALDGDEDLDAVEMPSWFRKEFEDA